MGLSYDRLFTPKSDRAFSPSLFYNLLLLPALKVFEVREAKLSPRESPSHSNRFHSIILSKILAAAP